jgi:hypothetical protein
LAYRWVSEEASPSRPAGFEVDAGPAQDAVKAIALAVPTIVTTPSRKRTKLERADRAAEPDDDPEATARVRAFIARIIRPRG